MVDSNKSGSPLREIIACRLTLQAGVTDALSPVPGISGVKNKVPQQSSNEHYLLGNNFRIRNNVPDLVKLRCDSQQSHAWQRRSNPCHVSIRDIRSMTGTKLKLVRRSDELHIMAEACELYAFAQLSERDEQIIEEHLLVCEYCRGALEQVEDEIRLLKEALRLSELDARREAARKSFQGKLIVIRPGRQSASNPTNQLQ